MKAPNEGTHTKIRPYAHNRGTAAGCFAFAAALGPFLCR